MNFSIINDIKSLPQINLNHSAPKYFMVGVSAFASDYLTLLFCYYVLKLPLGISTSLGFFTGFAISFSINKQWVFRGDHKKKNTRQLAEYLTLLSFNYFFTVWAVAFLNSRGIKPAIGKIGVMALIMFWNYAAFRWVIFSHQKAKNLLSLE